LVTSSGNGCGIQFPYFTLIAGSLLKCDGLDLKTGLNVYSILVISNFWLIDDCFFLAFKKGHCKARQGRNSYTLKKQLLLALSTSSVS